MTKVIYSYSSSLLFVSNLCFFGPFTIYQGNVNEFAIPLKAILNSFFLPGLALFLILGSIGLLLSRKSHQIYVSLLFTLGILAWLQGNILVWRYGLLDGQGLNLTKHVWRGWVDGALWMALIIIGVLCFKKIHKIAAFASLILMFLLALSLVFTSLKKPETWTHNEKSLSPLVPQDALFEFSPKQNIVHFVLDGFQSDLFEELVASAPGFYARALEGFTFFKEAVGSFPTTYMGVPALLSEQIYKNDIPMPQFVDNINQGMTIYKMVFKKGYASDIISDIFFTKGTRYTNRYRIAIPYGGTRAQIIKSDAALMLDLVLFRHAPYFLKGFVYNHDSWLVQRWIAPKDSNLNIRYFSHQAFLDDLIRNLSVRRKRPVYKYIQLMTTHFPIVVNKDCQYEAQIPDSRENMMFQAKCGLGHFLRFIEKLRQVGLYDSSLIILQADHGLGRYVKMKNEEKPEEEIFFADKTSLSEIAASAMALLAIKPPYSRGDLKVSTAQVSLTDIPATIGAFLHFKWKFAGRPVFEVDPTESRDRKFYYYKWRDENWQSAYFPRLDEFVIKGSVKDQKSWRLNFTYYPPTRPNTPKQP